MGIKGDKLTEESTISAEMMTEKLAPIGGITTKKMFGGHGLFHDAKMFGLIDSKGIAFFKVTDESRPDVEAKGAHQHSRMPYFSIPIPVFEDHETLLVWAKQAIVASKDTKKKK